MTVIREIRPEGVAAPPRSIIESAELQVYVQGIGSQLLQRMLDLLRDKGHEQVSLSVQKANYAFRMYHKAGFNIIEDKGDEVLMLRRL